MKKKGLISIVSITALIGVAGFFIANFLTNYTTQLLQEKLNEAFVAIQGNRSKIIGITELDYSNLQIAVKDENHRLLHRIKNAVLSELANTVLRTNNEKSSPHFKKGVIEYDYHRNESFFRNI